MVIIPMSVMPASGISVQSGVVADLDRRLSQIDRAVEKATAKSRTGSAMALADQQRKSRTELVAQRTSEARALGRPTGREGRGRWRAPEGRGRPRARPVSGGTHRRHRRGRHALVHPGDRAVARSRRSAPAPRSNKEVDALKEIPAEAGIERAKGEL